MITIPDAAFLIVDVVLACFYVLMFALAMDAEKCSRSKD